MRKVWFILGAVLLLAAACTPEETGYKWREEWDQGQSGGGEETPGLPEIKGLPLAGKWPPG